MKLKELQVNNQILTEKCRLLEKSDKDNAIIKQDNKCQLFVVI